MTQGYTLSKSAVTRTARAVRKSEQSPLRSSAGANRRIGGQQGGALADSFVAPAKIISGGNGLYKGDLLNDDGSIIESGADFIATRATGYDLPEDSYVVAYKVSVETLGSG